MFERIKRFVAVGLIFACFYSIYVGVLYLLQGPEPFRRLGTNIGVVIGTYFFGGIAAGVAVGVLSPLAQRRTGAIVVGIVAAFFVFSGILFAYHGSPTQWSRNDWITIVVLPVLFGTFAGNSFWKRPVP